MKSSGPKVQSDNHRPIPAFVCYLPVQRRAGITGLSTHVIFVSRSGYSDSKLAISDTAPFPTAYGHWRARPEDAVALFFNYNTMSGPLGTVQADEAALGIPFSNRATGVQTHEMFVEANYNIHVYRGVDFRPESQYIIRPNGQSNIRDAAVFGFEIHVEF